MALAAALRPTRCEIYTDVDGVYTADPRVVPDARKLTEISYEEMLELAQPGREGDAPARGRAGQVYDMPILVRSSFDDAPGHPDHADGDAWRSDKRVRGIAHDTDVAKITLRGVPDRPGIARRVFEPLAEAGDQRRRHRPERQLEG